MKIILLKTVLTAMSNVLFINNTLFDHCSIQFGL